MENTVKTAEIALVAANYSEMFSGLMESVEALHAENPNSLSWTPFGTPEAVKAAVNAEITWAKQRLKKQDRIVWYLRWARVLLAYAIYRDEKLWKMHVYPFVKELDKLIGNVAWQEILRANWKPALEKIRSKLDHYLALPVAKIQNTVFDKQSPDGLFTAFETIEGQWKEESKSLLQPQEGDEIAVQFPDGWAWWKLGRGYCPAEAKAMGHCGNVAGQYAVGERILSLRRPVKREAATYWEPHLTFILDSDGLLGEMKGRGNEKPAERYHPYIIALLERTDIVKGIKGGGYKPQNNFKISDLDFQTETRLEEKNPNLLPAHRKLRQLGGKPDSGLVRLLENALSLSGWDESLNGWVEDEWETPGDFIQMALHGGIREAYLQYIGDMRTSVDSWDANQLARKVVDAMSPDDTAMVFEEIRANLEAKATLENLSGTMGLEAKPKALLMQFLYHGNKKDTAPVKLKLIDAWKAGLTPEVRKSIGEALRHGLLESTYPPNGRHLIFGTTDFWNEPVRQVFPVGTAAAQLDGIGDWDREGDEDERSDEGYEIDFSVHNIPWDVQQALKALREEFQQRRLPLTRAQHASLLLQKGAAFEMVAADYEGMFKNVLAPTKTEEGAAVELPNFETINFDALVRDEIAWAKKALQKQDRIVWWLRWFRLAILGQIRQSLYFPGAEREWSPAQRAAATTAERMFKSEMGATQNRTGLVPEVLSLRWFKPQHQTMQHFLSLPVQKIQGTVWDKQTPKNLLDAFKEYEEEWQEQTEGMLKPNLTPNSGIPEEAQGLQEKLDELQIDLKQLQGKAQTGDVVYEKLNPMSAEREVVAVSDSPRAGYAERRVSPQEIQQEIAEVEAEIAKVTEEFNAKNTPEVDTVFIQFQDGWAWWKLSRAYCSEEAKAMGHCGNVVGQDKPAERILSLRVPKKVAEETYWEPHLTFILEPNGYLGEMKGKANQKPAQQYHKYIISLLEDQRIKGIRGGGYAPERNFAMGDLTPEQREEIIQKNPNMMALSRQLAEALKLPAEGGGQGLLYPSGRGQAVQAVIAKIEDTLWPKSEGYKPPKFNTELNGWVTDTWKDVDTFVEYKGNDTAKWVAGQLSEGDFFDYSEGVDLSQVIETLNSKQEAMLRKFIESEHADEVQQWKDTEIENGEEDPSFEDADLSDFISEYGLDDVESSLVRAFEDANRSGAEGEMYDALSKAVQGFEIAGTGELLNLPTYERKVKGPWGQEKIETGITWDSPVSLYLTVQAAAELADRGENFEYYENENVRGETTVEVEQPYNGWSGWDDGAFNSSLEESFGTPSSPEEAAQEQERLEAEAKVRPDMLAVRQNGKIVGWNRNPEYKGPPLGPGGVEIDKEGNPVQAARDTTGWKVVTESTNEGTGQRSVQILDGEGNAVGWRSGTRATDEEIIKDFAKQGSAGAKAR